MRLHSVICAGCIHIGRVDVAQNLPRITVAGKHGYSMQHPNLEQLFILSVGACSEWSFTAVVPLAIPHSLARRAVPDFSLLLGSSPVDHEGEQESPGPELLPSSLLKQKRKAVITFRAS